MSECKHELELSRIHTSVCKKCGVDRESMQIRALQAEHVKDMAFNKKLWLENNKLRELAQAVVDEDEIGREIPYSEGLSDAIDNLAAALEEKS
jgi:hypothetical protein